MDVNERRERAQAEAARWLTIFDTRSAREASRVDREDFTEWLQESPLHVAEMLRASRVDEMLAHFRHWDTIPIEKCATADDTVVSLTPSSTRIHRRSRPLQLAWGLAAAVVLAVTIGVFYANLQTQLIATDRAERREISLNDGSVVELDPQTKIRVKFEAHARYVTLLRGRALFRIAKDIQRPFFVKSADAMVQAIGTAFGVEQLSGGVLVTVSEGKVAIWSAAGSVEDATRDSPSPGSDHASTPTVYMTADHQVTLYTSGEVTAVKDVDASRALAWAEGRLIFESTPLSEVVAQFNRYNRIQLQVSSPELENRAVSGVFQSSDPETLLAFIQAGARVTITRVADHHILITPGPPRPHAAAPIPSTP